MNIPNNQIVTPCSEMLTLKVISNRHLLDIILNSLPDGLMRNLNLRLVNKQFSNTFIRLIHKNHQEIKIEYIGEIDRGEQVGDRGVYINYRFVKLTMVDRYFRFIRDFANVKVERVITKNLWKTNFSCKKPLHDSIIFTLIGDNDIKALIGMFDLCSGCKVCQDMVKRIPEFGPVAIFMLRTLRAPFHFNKLIVTDRTIVHIANGCIVIDEKDNLNDQINYNVKPFITCDKLVIWISEGSNGVNNRLLPREVLNLMLNNWKVKTVELKFIFKNDIMRYDDRWSDNGLFTKFRFNDSYDSVGKSNMNLKLDEVVVDLSESYYCAKDISLNGQHSYGYENIIANVRRIFPTDKIFMKFSHWSDQNREVHKVVKSFSKTVFKENQRDLKIDICYFTKIESFSFHNTTSDKIELSVIPSNIYVQSQVLQSSIHGSPIHCYRKSLRGNPVDGPMAFSNEKWIGKECRILNSERNCVLNIDIFINENDQNHEFSEEQLKEQPDALVKHFLPSFRS